MHLNFAALQLFGALMPRFLGQKKLRIDDENADEPDDTLTMFNSVTAQELFSRHAELAPFLLAKLQECQLKQVNPSLVPILSMLSRVSPGLQLGHHHEHMFEFKLLFIQYFNHKEFMVRKLAAKSLIL